MDRKEVMSFFNKRPRNCVIITSDGKGDVNGAVFGSPRMTDEDTVVAAARDNRTFRNLQKNPKAAVIITQPEEVLHDSEVVRVYLEVTAIERDGELLEGFRKAVAERAGRKSAEGIIAALRFRVTDVRPLIAPLK